jgi:hypothetical protein
MVSIRKKRITEIRVESPVCRHHVMGDAPFLNHGGVPLPMSKFLRVTCPAGIVCPALSDPINRCLQCQTFFLKNQGAFAVDAGFCNGGIRRPDSTLIVFFISGPGFAFH